MGIKGTDAAAEVNGVFLAISRYAQIDETESQAKGGQLVITSSFSP